MKTPLVVVGTGGHARSVLDVIRCAGCCDVLGLLDSFRPRGDAALGLKVLGSEKDLPELCRATGGLRGLIAVGDNNGRRSVAARIRALVPGFEFMACVHPGATVAEDVVIGAGSVVMPGAVLVSGCRLGEGCIVNTAAVLDHEGRMGDYASLAPGAVCGGNVTLGGGTAVGLGARIVHRVTVGSDTVVGAGALVLDNLPDRVVAYGLPARVIRPREPGDSYL